MWKPEANSEYSVALTLKIRENEVAEQNMRKCKMQHVDERMRQKQSWKIIAQNFPNGKTHWITVYKNSANSKHSAEEAAVNHMIVWVFKTKDKRKYYKN